MRYRVPRLPLSQLGMLAAAALLGGGAAIAGVAIFGDLGGSTTTTVVEPAARPASSSAAASQRSLTVNEIYRRSASGVVQLTARTRPRVETDPFFGRTFQTPGQEALGSGFVIDKAGHIVTNFHVIDGATDIQIGFSNHDTRKARVVGTDPSTDLALLKVDADARALTPLPIGDSDDAQVGDQVVAIGNPFGLERTVTAGIVSALQRAVTAPNGYTIDHVIQTDAPINRGNSGGPLLNARGEVIGVNSVIETGGTGGSGSIGIGFAIPSNTVKTVVAQLLQNGRVERPYIGIIATPISPDLARVFRLSVDAGLLIERVEPGSPGAKAGLKGGPSEVILAGEGYRLGGDVVVSAGGRRVVSMAELRSVLGARKPGDTLELEVYRGDKKRTIKVKLGRQPASRPG